MISPVAQAANAFLRIYEQLPTPISGLINVIIVLFLVVIAISILMRLR